MEYLLTEYLLTLIISTTVWSIVWGIVVKKVIENKGYRENWFWWGFFFGIIALIVALTKPEKVKSYREQIALSKALDEKRNEDMLKNGGWVCKKCKRILPAYTGTCSCGNTKQGNKNYETNVADSTQKTDSKFDEIKKYKDLLDSGIITQEEFDEKKKELLGL